MSLKFTEVLLSIECSKKCGKRDRMCCPELASSSLPLSLLESPWSPSFPPCHPTLKNLSSLGVRSRSPCLQSCEKPVEWSLPEDAARSVSDCILPEMMLSRNHSNHQRISVVLKQSSHTVIITKQWKVNLLFKKVAPGCHYLHSILGAPNHSAEAE